MRQKESEESYGKELSEGLGYLNAFTPTEEREKFEQTVQGLFRTNWLIELVVRRAEDAGFSLYAGAVF